MIIEVTNFEGETHTHQLSADIDLELWVLGYTNDGKYPLNNLRILDWED